LSRAQQGVFQLGGAAITFLLLWAAGVLGPAGALLAMLIPFPAAYVHMRLGALGGGVVVLLTAGPLLVTDGPPGVLLYLLQFGLASFVLPLLLRQKMAWDRAIAWSTLTIVFAASVFLAGYVVRSGQSLGELVIQYVQVELTKVQSIYEQADLNPSQVEELKSLAARTADFLLLAYPGLIVVAIAVLMLFVVFLLARFSQGNYLIHGVSLSQWKAPDALIWLLILGGFGAFFTQGLVFQVAANLLTLLLPIYFLQGLAVVAHFFQRRGVAPALRVIGYMMMVVINPLPAIITGIGIFDLWVDFRHPKVKKS
jgi:uncharacterized protein YybS (DUF2232 family)